jgi:16S rRNA (uracil1498-N3)-methyltransferase
MADRYFADAPLSVGHAVLAGPETHHLIHVMRAARGMKVVLFDGGGVEFSAVVDRVARSTVELTVLAREEIDRELPFELTLGVALPKGDRQKWLVEKAVELGVTRVVPLLTERGVAQPVEQALARLRRAVIEASKQCGRNRLMEINNPQAWPDFVRRDPAETTCRLLAQPGGRHPGNQFAATGETPDRWLLAVGPEGGFTDEEVSTAISAGWHTVDLGPRTLRVETAALVMASMVAQTAPRRQSASG